MDLLTITLVLLILQFNGSMGLLQNDSFFYCWLRFTDRFPLQRVLNLILVVGLPCFCVLLLLLIVHDWLWGAVELAISVLVLAYSLGRGAFSRHLHEYIEAWNLRDFGRIPEILSGLDTKYSLRPEEKPRELHKDARKIFIISAFKRWFVVLFWYLLFGPVVALLYRLISLSLVHYLQPENDDDVLVSLLQRALFIMEWPMARLLALCFVVSGKVGQVFAHWCQSVLDVSTDNDVFILRSAVVALDAASSDDDDDEEDDGEGEPESIDVLQDQAIQETKAIRLLLNRCLILILVFALIIEIT